MYYVKRDGFDRWISKLRQDYVVVGPTKQDRFGEIFCFDNLELSKNTLYPPKKYFFPSKEDMLYSDGFDMHDKIAARKTILFLRPCDANALKVMDRHFIGDFTDPFYVKKRENTRLFVIACNEKCSKNSFCQTFGANIFDDYDVLLYAEKEGMHITAKSNEFISDEFEKRKMPGQKQISNAVVIGDVPFDHHEYAKETEKCISCAACTLVCPTCTCFSVRDSFALDLKHSTRSRKWSSCQNNEFTKVAGNYVFRANRKERLKHRILHKLRWFEDEYKISMCVGCGRCIETCPAGINMIKILKKINK